MKLSRKIGALPYGCARLALLVAMVMLATGCGDQESQPLSPEEKVGLPKPGDRQEFWKLKGVLYRLIYNTVGQLIGAFEWEDLTWQPIDDNTTIPTLLDARAKTRASLRNGSTANANLRSRASVAGSASPLTYLLGTDGKLFRFDPSNPANNKQMSGLLCHDTPPNNNSAVFSGEFDVSADGGQALIVASDSASRCVIAVDLNNWKIASRIQLTTGRSDDIIPGQIKFTPDGTAAYMLAYSNAPGTLQVGKVYVIDPAAVKITTTIPIDPAYLNLGQIAMSPDGLYAYLGSAISGERAIPALDITTNTIASYIPISTFDGTGLAVHPDGTRLYMVPYLRYGPVTVVDTATYQVKKTIPSQAGPPGGPAAPQPGYPEPTFTPDGRYLFLLNAPNGISVVDTVSDQVAAQIPVTPPPSGPGIPLNPQQYVTMFFVPGTRPNP